MANYQLNESKMFADITDGIAIIINSETGIYYGNFCHNIYIYPFTPLPLYPHFCFTAGNIFFIFVQR